jgi:transposase
MVGQKTFQPKQCYGFSLEGRIPADHLLRQVGAIVDFSFVRRPTARFYRHTGQPGIDPVVLCKMAPLGHLYGRTSERRLAEELRLPLARRWFLGYDLDERPPGRSVLPNARRRFGMATEQAFSTAIVRPCAHAGLVVGQRLYVDSALVRANAGEDSVGPRALLRQLPSVGEHAAALRREQPSEGAGAGAAAGQAALPPAVAAAAVCPAAPACAGPAAPPATPPAGPHRRTRRDPPGGGQGRTNDPVGSRSDPAAGLLSRGGVPLAS